MIERFFCTSYTHILPNGTLWDEDSWICIKGASEVEIINFALNTFGPRINFACTEEQMRQHDSGPYHRKNGIVFTFNIQENG